eukprot:gb/GECG01004367.1/.p1 GENE.gb/GECG01004367.1/~~gb/GECG01004367.1/.p1  ORF type:complete len:135 (+),score=7.92 gb/GECG01004367.1/:1-405(+)
MRLEAGRLHAHQVQEDTGTAVGVASLLPGKGKKDKGVVPLCIARAPVEAVGIEGAAATAFDLFAFVVVRRLFVVVPHRDGSWAPGDSPRESYFARSCWGLLNLAPFILVCPNAVPGKDEYITVIVPLMGIIQFW